MTLRQEFMLGNTAIALGLLEAGCEIMASYPGTPSSEILPEFIRISKLEGLRTYAEWSTNEKVAFDVALSAAIVGKRAACSMKQVGLNVAMDSLMSSAYIGTEGGLVIVSCDDPGPHSSQTEQDSRFVARIAKVPVFDPATPQEARDMAKAAMEISCEYKIPVILRPGIRVCHGREPIRWDPIPILSVDAQFKKDPNRWAATPRFRYLLHKELNKKLADIQSKLAELGSFNRHNLSVFGEHPLGVIAGGVCWAVVRDLLEEFGRFDLPLLKIGTPFPFPQELVEEFMSRCSKVLVLEETDSLMEYLIGDRKRVLGRLSGHVPKEGELVPEVILQVLDRVLAELGLEPLRGKDATHPQLDIPSLKLPIRKPRLCPGCPHRPVFFAIRRVSPKAVFTSDIGCYTLGINLGAVDTCLDMGAAITMATGFYHSFHLDGKVRPIIATIGDSTFFHSGTPGLLNAVYNNARFVLVILDNETTAMTGMQPTPGLGIKADGSTGNKIALEDVVKGCGVSFLKVVDSYQLDQVMETLKEAVRYTQAEEGGVAVVIARHPCVIAHRQKAIPKKVLVEIGDECTLCGLCLERFECPAIFEDPNTNKAKIDHVLCAGCGVCVKLCPEGAIKIMGGAGE